MTDRERKDYYLDRIKRLLILRSWFPGTKAKKLEEEMKIIMWNNSKEWTKEFMNKEVIPLLKKYGINAKEQS